MKENLKRIIFVSGKRTKR